MVTLASRGVLGFRSQEGLRGGKPRKETQPSKPEIPTSNSSMLVPRTTHGQSNTSNQHSSQRQKKPKESGRLDDQTGQDGSGVSSCVIRRCWFWSSKVGVAARRTPRAAWRAIDDCSDSPLPCQLPLEAEELVREDVEVGPEHGVNVQYQHRDTNCARTMV